jgi:glycosyltransferase involved in cell wall biosynthesis
LNAESPEVTVVIPTRDRWRYLRLALRAVLAQRNVSVEVVVVDDGSRDETPARLAELDDNRVRVLRNEASRGVSAARNLGIEHARAPWLAFLDDDDLWSPSKLQRQLAVAESAGVPVVYGEVAFVNDALEVIEILPAPPAEGLLRSLLRSNSIPAGASTILVRTELLRRLGGFDEGLDQVEDWDLWIRLAEAAPAAVCDELLVAYRVHTDNMILRHEAGAIEEIERLAAKHAELTAREGVEIDRVLHTRWIAWIHRRKGRRAAAAAMYLRGAIRYRNAGNIVRAGGALLGERVMGIAGGGDEGEPAGKRDVPWLESYRPD